MKALFSRKRGEKKKAKTKKARWEDVPQRAFEDRVEGVLADTGELFTREPVDHTTTTH